jgi:starch synthase
VRLLGLAQADPSVPTTGPGATSKFLFDALARRYDLVDRGGVDLSPLQRYLLAAVTFHPSREKWKTRLYWRGRLAFNLRTLNSRRKLRKLDEPIDLVMQVYGIFRTWGAPYVLYLDNTVQLSRIHWPEWVAVEGRPLSRLYAWERRLYRDARHVFTLGTPAARSLVDFYGVPEERVSVVGGGATFDALPEPSQGAREPVVLFVGSDWRRKGGDVLVEAFRRVRAKLPEARLQIVGTREPPEEAGVEALGFLRDRAHLADLYAAASVFCLPSRFEPYGLAALEAMAYELPCVVTDVGALGEIVLDGETGLVVPSEDPDALGDALLRILQDPQNARRLGTNGRGRVEAQFTWDAVVERMSPHLERALVQGPPGAARPSRFRRGSIEAAERPRAS